MSFAATTITLFWGITMSALSLAPLPGTQGHYATLTAKVHTPPPFDGVHVEYGPQESVGGRSCVWWQLSVHRDSEDAPLLVCRALTSRYPFDGGSSSIEVERYLVGIPDTGERLEYRNVHTGKALLPGWRGFMDDFVPNAAIGCGQQHGMPETAEYLGHTLTLQQLIQDAPWEEWRDVQILELDPELLVGTGRNFKDEEGHRLPQEPERQNYTYIPFAEDDYRTMIDAGVNLFTIRPAQEAFVRSEPVFYLRPPNGEPALRYPADIYRSNYLGMTMFMDEPAIIMVGDKHVHNTLQHFSDAASLLQRRIRERYNSGQHYSAFQLDSALREAHVNLGDMRLEQCDYPAWETIFETAYYQLRAPLAGIVHEGRYQLEPFNKKVARWTPTARSHTPEELLRYHFAFLRGAARAFGKHWGTSIYGQCAPAISPLALTLAYDMGARYLWFWTSDHDHHMPWPEQLELVRALRQHAEQHPRRSIDGTQPILDKVITIPYPYFLSLENLWWVRELDKELTNEAAQQYGRLLRKSLTAIHQAMDLGEDFDIAVDEGQSFENYRTVIRISETP